MAATPWGPSTAGGMTDVGLGQIMMFETQLLFRIQMLLRMRLEVLQRAEPRLAEA